LKYFLCLQHVVRCVYQAKHTRRVHHIPDDECLRNVLHYMSPEDLNKHFALADWTSRDFYTRHTRGILEVVRTPFLIIPKQAEILLVTVTLPGHVFLVVVCISTQ